MKTAIILAAALLLPVAAQAASDTSDRVGKCRAISNLAAGFARDSREGASSYEILGNLHKLARKAGMTIDTGTGTWQWALIEAAATSLDDPRLQGIDPDQYQDIVFTQCLVRFAPDALL